MRMAKYICMTGLLAVMMTGCGKEKVETVIYQEIVPQETVPLVVIPQNWEEEKEMEEVSETESTQEKTVIAFADEKNVVYQITENRYEEGAAKLSYPQITGMEDEALQTEINQAIEKEVKADFAMEGLTAYEMQYETATRGTGIFSVVFRGSRRQENQSYAVRFAKTLNIDMTTGKNLRLKDYADVAEIVSCLEQDYGYGIVSENVERADFSAFMNNGYMTDYAITLLDYDVDLETSQMEPAGYSCIRDNKVVLFIETEHSMGDYAEIVFENPLTD